MGAGHSRTDDRGIVTENTHDEFGRVKAVTADYAGALVGLPIPQDLVERVDFDYDDALSMLTTATSRSGILTTSDVVADNAFVYDHRQRLLEDAQSHGDDVSAQSPRTEYAWEDTSTIPSGATRRVNRLTSVTYPILGQQPPNRHRQIELDYGLTDSMQNYMDLVVEINDIGVGGIGNLVRYDRLPSGKLVGREFGYTPSGTPPNAMEQTFADSTGYPGFDLHGQPQDTHYQTSDTTPTTLYRSQIVRDIAGRVTAAETDFANLAANARSWTYSYDSLNRLLTADCGELVGSVISGGSSLEPNPLGYGFTYDNLGNLTGDSSTAGLVETNVGFASGTRTTTHTTNTRNEIESISRTGASPASESPVYSPSGSLVADDDYVYIHDAWNRLAAVYQRGSVTFDAADSSFRYMSAASVDSPSIISSLIARNESCIA